MGKITGLITIALVLFVFFTGCMENEKKTKDEESYFSSLMKEEPGKGFLKAHKKRDFVFPLDHGIHKGFQTEWWYFTGNLRTEDNKRFGYQFTIFRSQLNPKKDERESSFSSNAIFMGHFALTDVENKKFYHFQKFARENKKNAFVKLFPFEANLDGWSVRENDKDYSKLENLKLNASEDEIEVDFKMSFIKDFVLQGDKGLSQKSTGKGNASYYYSATRIETSGLIKIKGKVFNVSGLSWMDREWSTSALSKDQEGWDWFSLHLSDGTDLMFYNLRLKSGKMDPLSKGIIVFKNGDYEKIESENVKLKVFNRWESPNGGVYPSGWVLSLNRHDIELEVEPMVKNQELNFFIRYWEGAVNVRGRHQGRMISGSGYVELTGYDGG